MSELDTLSMAKIVGLDKLYFHCYYEPTLQAHATVTSLTARLLAKDGGITFNEGAQHEKAKQALIGAHNVIILVIVFQNEYFKLGIEDEIKDRCSDFHQVWESKAK